MKESLQQQFFHYWQQYSGAISRVAASYEINPHKREELVQEIALACWKALPGCKDHNAIKGFLLRIAHNKSVDHVSKQVREPKGNEDIDSLPEQLHGHSDKIQYDQKQVLLLQAMQQLPLDQKQVVGLLFEGMSYQQISEITGFSTSNVGVMINRSKKRLQELLNAE